MKKYLDILSNVYNNGINKKPVRFEYGIPINVENETKGTFCEVFRHNMSDGFPLLTTRKIPIKSLCIELEGFIKGITDKSWYRKRGCKYWNFWANPVIVRKTLKEEVKKPSYSPNQCDKSDLEKSIKELENDLGPIYGYQWRNFDGHYCDDTNHYDSYKEQPNGVLKGCDQLKDIVNKLHNNPYDRRMVCSAWNPNQINQMALPPCHYAFTVVVYGDKLNLCWKQRSCDMPLGVPSNIASYAILLKLLAKEAKLKEGELVGILEDCHIYNNQLNGVKEQLTRIPVELPELIIPDDNWNGIFNWVYKDIQLSNYHPNKNKIDFGEITV